MGCKIYSYFSTNHEVYCYPNVFSPLLLYPFLGSLWFRLQGISNEFRAKSLLAFRSNSRDSSEVFLHFQILIRPQDTAIFPNFSELQELATLFCCKYKLPTVRGSSFPLHRWVMSLDFGIQSFQLPHHCGVFPAPYSTEGLLPAECASGFIHSNPRAAASYVMQDLSTQESRWSHFGCLWLWRYSESVE